MKLEDIPVKQLKSKISALNKELKIKGYSTMKKSDLISAMRKHPKLNIKEMDSGVKLSIKGDVVDKPQTPKAKAPAPASKAKKDDGKVSLKSITNKDLLTNDRYKKLYNKSIPFAQGRLRTLLDSYKIDNPRKRGEKSQLIKLAVDYIIKNK